MRDNWCDCKKCRPTDPRSVFLMFAALVLLAAVLACIKINDRTRAYFLTHKVERIG